MNIKLGIPQGQRQQDLLDYLNSALRQCGTSFTDSGRVNDEGLLETSVTGSFSFDRGLFQLTWVLTKSRDGALQNLFVKNADNSEDEQKWQTSVYEFVTSVLATALSDKQLKFFQRSLFYYMGPQLDGEYWLPGYRFAPAYAHDTQPYLINAERVVTIDQTIEATDEIRAAALAEESAQRHAARLSLLLNTGLYKSEGGLRWVNLTVGRKSPENARVRLGFILSKSELTEMPKKGQLCPLGAYNGTLSAWYRVAGQLQSLPPEARKILRGIDKTEPIISDAFDRGARLYQVACILGRFFPSVGLAYRVAAVDAIRKADTGCKGFKDFMQKHAASVEDIQGVLNYLYETARSAHFHGGEFPIGEYVQSPYLPYYPLMHSGAVYRDHFHHRCLELIRKSIVNWLVKVIPEVSEPNCSDQT